MNPLIGLIIVPAIMIIALVAAILLDQTDCCLIQKTPSINISNCSCTFVIEAGYLLNTWEE